MAKGPTTRQKFNEPAASSVGDVPVAGKAAMQQAAANVQKAGMNPYRYRQASSPKISAGGAVGFLGIISAMSKPAAPRKINPGYYPSPTVFGAKAA